MEIFRLEGKVAVVTGGCGLYGKPITLALAEAGARVIIASRNRARCSEYAGELQGKGLKAESVFYDQGDEKSIDDLINYLKDNYGRLDILVNNSVSWEGGKKNLDNITISEMEKSQMVNFTGLILLTQAVVRMMVKKNSGSIINISSIQGVVGPNFTVYGNTGMSSGITYTYQKWGVIGFTKWIANFYGKNNIRANCISPGGYGPGIRDANLKEEFVVNYKRLTPLGRFAEHHDIKGPVVFLASDASAYITGHNLILDGGWTSW